MRHQDRIVRTCCSAAWKLRTPMKFVLFKPTLLFYLVLISTFIPVDQVDAQTHRSPVMGSTSPSIIRLTDVSRESGVSWAHSTGGSGQAFIVEGVSAGVATFDYNNDGLIDIYLLNGRPLKGTAPSTLSNALYRNNGDFTFTDVTAEAGVSGEGYGLGVVTADYDGDGDLDIYLNNYGPNVLYRNNGDRTFTNVTADAGVDNGNKVGAGASFFDADGDGDLDLFVGNYIDFTYENHVEILRAGKRFSAGPQYYRPVADTLYRNDGNGRFTDVSKESNITSAIGPSMGMVAADLDDDGDIDVFVCNDGEPNFLWQNDGKGRFEEVGLLSGVALDFEGHENSNMGVDIGDYDQDGLVDLITTNFQAEIPVLRRNLGAGIFEDVTAAARLPITLTPHVNWGTGFVDFDNDGDRDIYIACGHFDPVELMDDSTAQKVRDVVLENIGRRYRDVSSTCGSGLEIVQSSRGACFEDLDNDGDVDVVVLNSDAKPSILRNDTPAVNQWCQIELRQPGMNAHAVGARVTVKYANKLQRFDVVAGRGYQGHFGSRISFGFPKDTTQATAEVRWPDGVVQSFELNIGKLNKLDRRP
jgi:hypothetical protein